MLQTCDVERPTTALGNLIVPIEQGMGVDMDEESEPETTRSVMRRAGRWVAFAFWTLQFIELTAANWAADPPNAKAYLFPRAVVVLVGIILTIGLVEVTAIRSRGLSLARRIGLSLAAALLASVLIAGANYVIYIALVPIPGFRVASVQFIYQLFAWSWFFATIAAAMLAISYSLDVRDQERRLAEAQAVAQSAQLRALRYQLNPHFLFNTLNSVAGLINERRAEAAEQMVENLSDYLRASLELDPHSDIRLEDELDLQSRYLEIEKLRFPERLVVEVDVPASLKKALVPSLITQPLIENAIRHGVARSRKEVILRVQADADEQDLLLRISNNLICASSASRPGTGLGLANVAARLEACFGPNQGLEAGALPSGGFAVNLRMPLRYRPE